MTNRLIFRPDDLQSAQISKALSERLTPLSLRHCRAARHHPETQTYSLCNQELNYVKVVARLVDVVTTTEMLKATLEDHTGQLVASMMRLRSAHDQEADDTAIPQLKYGGLCHFTGCRI